MNTNEHILPKDLERVRAAALDAVRGGIVETWPYGESFIGYEAAEEHEYCYLVFEPRAREPFTIYYDQYRLKNLLGDTCCDDHPNEDDDVFGQVRLLLPTLAKSEELEKLLVGQPFIDLLLAYDRFRKSDHVHWAQFNDAILEFMKQVPRFSRYTSYHDLCKAVSEATTLESSYSDIVAALGDYIEEKKAEGDAISQYVMDDFVDHVRWYQNGGHLSETADNAQDAQPELASAGEDQPSGFRM